jgi:hypothetical protein
LASFSLTLTPVVLVGVLVLDIKFMLFWGL